MTTSPGRVVPGGGGGGEADPAPIPAPTAAHPTRAAPSVPSQAAVFDPTAMILGGADLDLGPDRAPAPDGEPAPDAEPVPAGPAPDQGSRPGGS